MSCLLTVLCPLVAGISLGVPAAGDVEYERDIKPLLARHCTRCHGARKQESALRLDSLRAAREGGDRGPAIQGDAAASLLLVAITGSDPDLGRMPPEGAGLSDEETGLIKAWLERGAPGPQDESAGTSAHWSFRPIQWHAPPAVKNPAWVTNPMDHFVLARLEQAGIEPSPPADRATRIRRLSLDLLGLPPDPAEVDAFLSDVRPDAYERLVDRFLSSPAYGERWGRHWLDLARYADSNGYTRDFGREIWAYRDWVVDAVNRDTPFDQFTVEQFAGDMLPDATPDQIVATGFHRNTLINEEGGTDPEQFRVDAVADRVATTGEVFLGLTLGCARCHEHKYDPISQREYYQLFAFLNNCDEPIIDAPTELQRERGELEQRGELRKQIADLEAQLEKQKDQFEQMQRDWEKTITPEQRVKLPGPTQAALDVPSEKRDATQNKLVADLFKQSDIARQSFPLVDRIQQLRRREPKIPTTMILRERAEPRESFVHLRGNFLDPGDRVDPDVPRILHPLPSASAASQPNRLDLARWLVDPANPLTPRVVVNRHWQHFFGRGIVETENDFGTQGSLPTHPELLDWLASELIRRGWSIKAIHRLIVTSATYQQVSAARPELATVDPANQLLARQQRVRLDAEVIRDAALRSSGLLVRTIGGPSVFPPQPEGVFEFTQDPKPWNTEAGGNRYRRGMYTYFWRSSPYPALIVFDAPNANVTCTRRVRSNTPLQALTLANDEQFVECARGLAARVMHSAPRDDAQRLRYAFRLCLARAPGSDELARLMALLAQQREAFQSEAAAARQVAGSETAISGQGDEAELAAWTLVARVLLNLDEFITRE